MAGWDEYGKWQATEGVSLLRDCGLKKGMKGLDFGCAIGEFSIPAGYIVGEEGSVFAVDKNSHLIKSLKQACETYHFSQIHPIKATEETLELPAELDFVFYFDLYHAFGKSPKERSEENQRIIRTITKGLKKDGLFLLAVFWEMTYIWDEEHGHRTKSGALSATRVTFEEGIRWFRLLETVEECGFTLVKKVPGIPHFDEFWKKGEPDFDLFDRNDIYVFQKK